MNSQKVDILIENALLVTMDKERRIVKNGYIAIKGSKIEAIGEGKHNFTADETIDACGNIVMPGLVNTHTHAAMTIFRGFADDYPLMDWLQNYIWPAEQEIIDQETVILGSELAICEMLKSGTTTFNDMYFFCKDTAKVSEKVGIRIVTGESLLDIPAPFGKTPKEYHIEAIEEYLNNDLVTPSVINHAPYTCTAELLQYSKELSDKYKIPHHIHVSETEFEFNKFKDEHGKTPVKYLDDLGILGERTIAVHSVFLTDDDIDIYKKRGVKVAHNPESNQKLASGASPVVKMLEKGVCVGFGTDGAASNNNLDMFEEMSTAAKFHKFVNMDPTVLNAETAVAMATIEGAKVLGLDDKIGSLEVGKQADIITIDIHKPHLTPMYVPYSHLAYSVQGSDVDSVIVAGKVLMKNRQLLTIDENEVMKKVNELAIRIEKIKK